MQTGHVVPPGRVCWLCHIRIVSCRWSGRVNSAAPARLCHKARNQIREGCRGVCRSIHLTVGIDVFTSIEPAPYYVSISAPPELPSLIGASVWIK
jgi:hypothetical protein